VYVQLHVINEDYFEFLLSLEKYNETYENPFAEPVMVFSNIENGLGLFSSYSTYTDSIYVE
jgi:hypothetical protein